MKSIIVSMAAAAGLMIAGSAMAVDMPAEAKELGCTNCHKIEGKLVGPGWMDVSKFYNGKEPGQKAQKSAKEATGGKAPAEWLHTKVSNGGKGNWGSAEMVANNKDMKDAAKDAKIKHLVSFIMGLAK